MKINAAYATLLLVFCPKKLGQLAADYNAYVNRSDVVEERQRRDATAALPAKKVAAIRQGLGLSFALVAGSFAVAAIGGRFFIWRFGRVAPVLLEVLQYIGIGILLWATLAKLGYLIETTDGDSIEERVNNFVFNALYVLGSVLLALSVTMQLGE